MSRTNRIVGQVHPERTGEPCFFGFTPRIRNLKYNRIGKTFMTITDQKLDEIIAILKRIEALLTVDRLALPNLQEILADWDKQ